MIEFNGEQYEVISQTAELTVLRKDGAPYVVATKDITPAGEKKTAKKKTTPKG